MSNGVNELTEGIGKLAKMAPDVYDDGLKPTIQESGKLLGLIPRTINAALVPLQKWILTKENNFDETKKILAIKLENIDPNKIVPPEPHVAIPALQAISYSMDSDELRNLYANLLANSMNLDTKDEVHPAFVEIIKQLSPFEANLLSKIFPDDDSFYSYPIIKVRKTLSESDSSGWDFAKHILSPQFCMNTDNQRIYSIAVENLVRLNLICVDYTRTCTNKSLYDETINSMLVSQLKNDIIGSEDIVYHGYNYPYIQKGMLESTDLGQSFAKICIN